MLNKKERKYSCKEVKKLLEIWGDLVFWGKKFGALNNNKKIKDVIKEAEEFYEEFQGKDFDLIIKKLKKAQEVLQRY